MEPESSRKLKFFDLAKKLSFKSDHKFHKLGCVIAKKNKLVGIGFNKVKTSPHSNHPHKNIHAELSAILDSDRKDLIGATIYLFRQHKNGALARSYPCIYCQELIKLAGIKKICYSDYGQFKEVIL